MGNQESKIQVREVELPAIEIRDLVKVYKLYDRARDRVKDAFGLSRHKAQKRHYALNGVNLCIPPDFFFSNIISFETLSFSSRGRPWASSAPTARGSPPS